MRWLHRAALLLLVVGCLAKGVVIAKAAQLYGTTPQLPVLSLTLQELDKTADTRDEGGTISAGTCVSATHIGPLSHSAGINVPLRQAVRVPLHPPYPAPHGLKAQPPIRPPRLPA